MIYHKFFLQVMDFHFPIQCHNLVENYHYVGSTRLRYKDLKKKHCMLKLTLY